MTFFKILLFFLLIFMLLRLLGRLFIGSVSRRVFRNENTSQKRKEGEVTIDTKNSRKSKKVTPDEGEYISYEEVDDD